METETIVAYFPHRGYTAPKYQLDGFERHLYNAAIGVIMTSSVGMFMLENWMERSDGSLWIAWVTNLFKSKSEETGIVLTSRQVSVRLITSRESFAIVVSENLEIS